MTDVLHIICGGLLAATAGLAFVWGRYHIRARRFTRRIR